PRRVLGLPQSIRPDCPTVQSRQAFATVPINPFSNGPQADAYGLRDGLRRLPALDLQYNPLSTARRQPGILMHVHPVLRWNLKLQQPQLPRSEPRGQPTESSQLAKSAQSPRRTCSGRKEKALSNIVELRPGAVAVIVVDNPPVNALKQAVRAGLKDAFTRARDDAGIHAIVL